MSLPLLEFRAAGLFRGQSQLLKDLSFTLASGEILGIAGSNGAGKSSLLKLACSEHVPSDGHVLFQGQPVGQIDPRLRAQQMAVLAQNFSLQFDFSVRQLVTLGRSPHRDIGSTGEEMVERAITDCDLERLRDRSYLTLSGGERQRVQLARVLAQLYAQPQDGDLSGQLLILDEPTSATDIRHQERFLSLFRHLRDRGCSILLVMHDINLLSRCSDRLLLLRSGQIQALGATAELLTEAHLSRLFDYPLKLTEAHQHQPRLVYPQNHEL